MFKSVFTKVGKVAFNTAKNHSAKQNIMKSSMNAVKANQQSLKLSASFSTNMMYQQMYTNFYHQGNQFHCCNEPLHWVTQLH